MQNPISPAAEIIVSLVPIVSIVLASVLLFFVLLWRHHENKQRILKGTYEPMKFNLRAFTLLTGLCLTGVGIVLSTLFFLLNGVDWTLLGGAIPLFVGFAFLLFYKINPDFKDKDGHED
ncbi:MAG TPA: hypothetical protein DEO40_07140 [Treponema sp.]|jgi:hypothetical protein|nr:hypothetical protein [Treponema sp.]HBB43613.1 hypothetical protein [Treponema sp.]HCA20435.1 hypothetical protein [Treponema sp.]